MSQLMRNILVWLAISGITFVAIQNIYNQSPSQNMNYSEFVSLVNKDQISQVSFKGDGYTIEGITQEGNSFTTTRPIYVQDDQLMTDLFEHRVEVLGEEPQRESIWTQLLVASFPILIILAIFFFFMRQMQGGMGGRGGPMSFGKSKARMLEGGKVKTTFRDVAGVEEAKEEVQELVDFLRDPSKFQKLGGKIPRGILMVGSPGTGKTLLARAIAGEAKVPFFTISGSDFVEMFVGVGASRVRDMFEQAKRQAPCIVFIDEIDAVGRERGAGVGGGNDEREQTLNQLLTEMDGFKENKGVIVVGATNRVDILDAALLRPGRFDRQVTVNLPDRLGRISILKVHAKNKPLGDDVSLVQLANRTPGFSGADLANLLNEAAILATRYKKATISKNEVNQAIDRVIGGIAGTPMEDSKNKKLIAYHEVGHAITGTVLQSHDEVEKITITPRGSAKGLTWFTPEEDQSLISRSALLARIIGTLGGRAAEQIIFGDPEVTTGASSDLQQVTNLARQMVTRFGMSNIGPIALEDESNGQVFLGATMNQESEYPESIADRIDDEVCKIINYCEEKALQIILDNRVIIDLIVERLLDVETMEGDEFRELLSTYTILPNKKAAYISKLA